MTRGPVPSRGVGARLVPGLLPGLVAGLVTGLVAGLVAVLLLGGCGAPARGPDQLPDERWSPGDDVRRTAAAVVDGLEQRLGARAEPAVAGSVSCVVGERYAVDVQLRGFAYLDDPRAGREVEVIDEVLRSAGLETAPGAGRGGVVGARGGLRVAVSPPPVRRVDGAPRAALRTVSATGGCRSP